MFQFNFVGRLLGPRGNSLKRVEAFTGCRVFIRGKGSIKDPDKVLFFLQHTFASLLNTALILARWSGYFNPLPFPYSFHHLSFCVSF
jgi:hypothetical protein